MILINKFWAPNDKVGRICIFLSIFFLVFLELNLLHLGQQSWEGSTTPKNKGESNKVVVGLCGL